MVKRYRMRICLVSRTALLSSSKLQLLTCRLGQKFGLHPSYFTAPQACEKTQGAREREKKSTSVFVVV